MKKIIYSILILFVLLIQPFSVSAFDKWTTGDKALELTYLTLQALDYGQTRHIAHNPDRFYETNTILGRHPSEGRVNTLFAITAIAHPVITHVLPQKYRKYFQLITIGYSASNVYHNYRIGIDLDF